jgi:rhodanese-related sulfurtransferase
MNAAGIARQLHGRKSGATWLAHCPSHDDKNLSLSLRDADGKVLVHCHAGCDQRAVIAALRARGLWPEQALRQHRRIVAEYDYIDEAGNLFYQVVRTEPKGFFQRRPDGNGGFCGGERGKGTIVVDDRMEPCSCATPEWRAKVNETAAKDAVMSKN